MTNYERTAQWLAACGKEVGNSEHTSVQIGCHIEEFVEFMTTLQFAGESIPSDAGSAAVNLLALLARELKRGQMVARIDPEQLAEGLDSLCDLEVTGNGVAYLAGFNKVGADEMVLQANERKLVDGKPVILEGGKIGKPEGWKPADLTQFITPTH